MLLGVRAGAQRSRVRPSQCRHSWNGSDKANRPELAPAVMTQLTSTEHAVRMLGGTELNALPEVGRQNSNEWQS